MKKNIIVYILLGFLMVMNAVLLFIVVKEPEKRMRPPREFIYDRLNFREEQVDQFLEIDAAHRNKMKSIDGETRRLKETLFSNLERENEKVDSIASRIGSLSKERELELHSYFKQIEDICDQKQRKQLEHMLRGAVRPKPPGHGPHDGPPPPRQH